MKIALIIPYFGEWPAWFPLYLRGCELNPVIDILFFTDCKIPEMSPSNVYFYPISFEKYKTRVSEALGIDFNHHKRYYKLCDLKPFYGVIHKKELERYDFWGYGDIDVVYGNLKLLLTEENLLRYDLFSTQSIRLSGPFTIMRKNSRYTEMCLQFHDWKRKLEADENFQFDELEFSFKSVPYLRAIRFLYYHFPFKRGNHYNDIKYYDFFARLLKWTHPHVHFKDMKISTPSTCDFLYDLSDGKVQCITCPKEFDGWKEKLGKLYLELYSYKENWARMKDNEWYKIANTEELRNGVVKVSLNGIEFV